MMFQKGLHFRSDESNSISDKEQFGGEKGNLKTLSLSLDSENKKQSSSINSLLRTTLRRFAVAVATLRLTAETSPGAALITTSAATTSTAIGYSLKLILVGCFYIVAFLSILMLIVHINHQVVTNAQNGRQIEIAQHNQRASSKIELEEEEQQQQQHQRLFETNGTSNPMEVIILNDPDDDRPLKRKRFKRHSPKLGEWIANPLYYYLSTSKPPASGINQRTKAFSGSGNSNKSPLVANKSEKSDVRVASTVWSAQLPESVSAIRASETLSIQSSSTYLPDLTYRQAQPDSYSPNNRGAMNSSSVSVVSLTAALTGPAATSNVRKASELSQWIPILHKQQGGAQQRANQVTQVSTSVTSYRKPLAQIRQQQQPQKQTRNRQQQRQRQRQRQQKLLQQQSSRLDPIVLAAPATTVGVSIEASYQTDGGGFNRHHQKNDRPRQWRHQVDPTFYREKQWQRLRLNAAANLDHEAMRPNRLYKRVLLCDKTLVSLDYIGNFEPTYGPFEHNFEDNVIDLGSDWDSVLLDRRFSNSTAPISTAQPTTTSTVPPNPIDSGERLLAARTDGIASAVLDGSEPTKRSYLTDEDPLVKCDMWDLEKGLKNRKPPVEILRMAVKADFDTVRDAINRCRQLTEKTLPPDDEFRDGIEIMSTDDLVSLFSMKRGLIPGTKWCGLGDQASSYNDLGPKHRIDICCRAHDHCPIRLKPFRNDYGVLNIALYTKSHCDCDADFYRCLREARSRTADMLGNLYFNVMKLQCMREERMKVCREMKPYMLTSKQFIRPTICHKKHRPIALGFERCVRYEESPVKTVFRFTTPPVAY